MWDVFIRAVEDGVTVTVRWDAKSQGFMASGTQRSELSPNAGLCVTARAGDSVLSWERLMYLLMVLGRGERWEDTQPMADPDRW
jgi:hypothetical protein